MRLGVFDHAFGRQMRGKRGSFAKRCKSKGYKGKTQLFPVSLQFVS